MAGSCFEAHAIELVGIDIQLVVGHFKHVQESRPRVRSVIEGRIGDAEIAEDLLLLGFESDLCVSEDEIVIVIRHNRQLWLASDVIDLLSSHTEQKAFSWSLDTIRINRVNCEATNDCAVGESDEGNQVLDSVEVVVEVDQIEWIILVDELALTWKAAHIFV
jgi:hypothetical protein